MQANFMRKQGVSAIALIANNLKNDCTIGKWVVLADFGFIKNSLRATVVVLVYHNAS